MSTPVDKFSGLVRSLFALVCLSYSLIVYALPQSDPSVTRQPVRIGVLALRGVEAAQQSWQPTADYLTQHIPGYQFKIVPLAFTQIDAAVAEKQVDFVIVNSAIHVSLAERYGASPVATLINRLDDYDASLFGGVIFRRQGNPEPASVNWLKGKDFVAVSPSSLGGFLAGWGELHRHGINPYKDFKTLHFAGTHDAAVMTVLAGQADAGTVRTDVLERMRDEGKIHLSDIEVIAPLTNGSTGGGAFPYLRSTRLYPEWPISKLTGVPDALAKQVSLVLLAMPKDSEAARKAEIFGWNVPMNYVPVADLLRDLELDPFEPAPLSLQFFIDKQPLAAVLIAGGLAVTSGFVVVLLLFNRRLHAARKSLVLANEELEARVKARTAALEASELELANLATHDPLTGLLNRRALEEKLLDEINRTNRYGQTLSVLMVDIDHFKHINDTFGHLAGDSVLKHLSVVLTQAVRNTDVVARYGGEEFVIILPVTDRQEALMLAERLCRRVEAATLPLENGQMIRVTVSIGIASADASGSARWDALVDAADRAMYRAKEGGRNQVCCASSFTWATEPESPGLCPVSSPEI